MQLSDTEAAYAAGILDGEGSICFSRNHTSRWPSPIVSVASTDREVLEWLQSHATAATPVRWLPTSGI